MLALSRHVFAKGQEWIQCHGHRVADVGDIGVRGNPPDDTLHHANKFILQAKVGEQGNSGSYHT